MEKKEERKPEVEQEINLGSMTLALSTEKNAPGITITDDGVSITSYQRGAGIFVGNSSCLIQGMTVISASGKNVVKGNYTENPNSKSIFTHQETVLRGTIPEGVASAMVGVYGLNDETSLDDMASLGIDGIVPITTDPPLDGVGGPRHVHTITTKHVHRLEPAYLYRMPGILKSLKELLGPFVEFLNA